MASGVVRLDSKGRILLPREVRERLGLREGSRLLVRVREDGVVELVPLDRLYAEVASIFSRRMRGWREEDHEATRLLDQLMGGGGGGGDS